MLPRPRSCPQQSSRNLPARNRPPDLDSVGFPSIVGFQHIELAPKRLMASAEVKRARKGLNLAGDDDDYGDAFKNAKLEHDQQRESPTEAKRLQAEADADAAAMSDVVLPQLQAAAL